MIAGIIHACIRNRAMVLLLGAALVGIGWWSARALRVDAIPDLSDVQVIIRTDFPGQAPRIVEDQVTYPLTTAMLAVPQARDVRGFSMVGSSFVYVIFEDGTDLYWARSRVLEQLSTLAGRLPPGVTPQLGPDATGVGWVYQYVLETGPYCRDHPDGLWQDPVTGAWYAARDDAPAGQRERLEHHRIFPRPERRWVDPATGASYAAPDFAPAARRPALEPVSAGPEHAVCPLDGSPLVEPAVDLADLRSLQDWYLGFELSTVAGVSEVASAGGMQRQYQVVVDPVRLRALEVPLQRVRRAIMDANIDAGGRVIERSETEFLVRSQGYLGALSAAERGAQDSATELAGLRRERVVDDLRAIGLGSDRSGVPITLADVAEVQIGPQVRRGIVDWGGAGETVGGIVVMRHGGDARSTIERVQARLAELEKGLPPGVAIATAYDRSALIDRAVGTLTHTLFEEILVVSLVVLLFLLHARSALVAVVVLPTGVLGSLICMQLMGINANIMSLGGIAIAIGVMVDSAIVMVENAHKALEQEAARVAAGGEPRRRRAVIAEAAADVGPSLFFSLLIITVSFLPVFVLTGQSGRLFTPLAFTKTFAMAVAAVLSITLIPVLMSVFVADRVLPERWSRLRTWGVIAAAALIPAAVLAFAPLDRLADARWWLVIGWMVLAVLILAPQRLITEQRNPLSGLLHRLYTPLFALAMRFKLVVALVAMGVILWVGAGIGSFFLGENRVWPFSTIGSEFMPPLEEGDFLYMPNTDPGISVTKAGELLQQTDRLIAQFPEVVSVMGKIGRADTATDPAPLTMIETTIVLEADRSRWRQVPDSWLWGLIDFQRPITLEELTDGYTLPGGQRVPGINDALRLPGLSGALTRGAMPIRTRIDMLATGLRTPVGIKIMGPDLEVLSRLTGEVEDALRADPTLAERTRSISADRSVGGSYVDIELDRLAIARNGLSVAEVQGVVASALGGATITVTVEGRERYPVNLRYPRQLRQDTESLGAVLVATPSGAQIPLAELATISERAGPPMIKSENARPSSWLYITPETSDVAGYVDAARAVLAERLDLPAGYSLVWAGQYEYIQEANQRLAVALPLAYLAVVLLLYLATRSWIQTGMVLGAVPFAWAGAVAAMVLLDYQFSVATAVGFIALAGLDAETGLVMLHFLHSSTDRARAEGRLQTRNQLWWAVHEGAVQRIRPKTMTVVTTFVGLLPLMWADGAGADTMRRLAAPMLGGLVTSFAGELFVYPVVWFLVHRRRLEAEPSDPGPADATA